MKKLVTFIIIIAFLSPGAATGVSTAVQRSHESVPAVSDNAVQYGQGYRYNVQGMIYVHVEGTAQERGYQHGYLLYPEIMDVLYRWSNIIHNSPIILQYVHVNQTSPRYDSISERWWNYCRNKAVDFFWNSYPEEYKQEVEAIAKAVADRGGKMYGEPVTYEDILTLNEMYELMSMLLNPQKSVHPLRTLYYDLLGVAPELEQKENEFLRALYTAPPAHHCNGFFATGDATTDGQLVASHTTISGGWWYSYYIAQRWNVILDIVPSSGYRITMPTSPGLIWSDEDYYQNEQGILLIETTNPQGLWKKDGLPLAVRARTALQYGNSIDDVVSGLRENNNGVMNAVWLIGDTKTGEIARFELGLYASAIWRTKNGFYWSANNPMDASVRKEQLRMEGLKGRIYQLAHILFNVTGYQYYVTPYTPAERDIKFEELGNAYYGDIDVNVVKKIMSTPPINDFITDCKITDTYLLENNGLWAFWGKAPGLTWNTSLLQPNLRGAVDGHSAGWFRIFGIPEGTSPSFTYRPMEANGGDAIVQWSMNTSALSVDSPAISLQGTRLYTAGGNAIEAFNAETGQALWTTSLNSPTGVTSRDDLVIAGGEDFLYGIGTAGQIQWEYPMQVSSSPVIYKDQVMAGGVNKVTAVSIEQGKERWSVQVNGTAYLSDIQNGKDNMYIAAGSHCYCVDVESGTIEWMYTSEAPMTSPPMAKDDTVFVGSWDNHVYAVDADDGSLQWSFTPGWGVDTTPAVDKERVYVGCMDNTFYALERDTGKIAWTFTCRSAVHSSPALYGEYVFFGADDGRFYALNRTTGDVAWTYAPGYVMQRDVYNYITTALRAAPVIHNNTVYLGAAGHIYVLDAQTEPWPVEVETSGSGDAAVAWWIVAVVIGAAAGALAYLWYHRRWSFSLRR